MESIYYSIKLIINTLKNIRESKDVVSNTFCSNCDVVFFLAYTFTNDTFAPSKS